MILHWSKAASLLLAAALLLTSCMPGVFAGADGVQQAAQEAVKPPLVIAGDTSPLPPLHAEQYEPPRPPLRAFSVSAALFPQVAAAAAGPDALLLAPPAAGPAPTPFPAPVGPAFQWSQTDNYLILGTDHRPGWTNWRTDSVIIVGVDRANNRLAVFSIPRDLYVQIPGYGWGRINQVDYMGEKANPGGGGPQLVSQVLQETFGVSTNHWVRVRMDGFVDVVNAVGGVTVHLDCAFYEPIFNLSTNAWDTFALPAGDVWMDGDTAYWFVRLRLRESDIGRSRRQRQFLWALRDQVSKTNLLARFPDMWSAFQNTFTTDLSVFQMLDLLNWATNLEAGSVRASGLSLYDLQNYTTPEGAMVLRIADPARVRSVVEGVWNAPAMVDANRQDVTRCPALPPGVDFVTASTPNLSETDPDQTGGPPPEAAPPAAAPDAMALPTPTAAPAALLIPTPTPMGVGTGASAGG